VQCGAGSFDAGDVGEHGHVHEGPVTPPGHSGSGVPSQWSEGFVPRGAGGGSGGRESRFARGVTGDFGDSGPSHAEVDAASSAATIAGMR